MKYKLFKLYTNSVKEFKDKYFYVASVNHVAIESVANLDDAGEVVTTNIPIVWTQGHLRHMIATYSRKSSKLGTEDARTVDLLRTWAYHFTTPIKLINTQALIKARSSNELRASLCRISRRT